MMNNNYSADSLKKRGHGVIDESLWKVFDEMVDRRERERKIREDLMVHRLIQAYPVIKNGRPDRAIGIYSTNDGMLYVDLPYLYSFEECLRIIQDISRKIGLCYGMFNNVPMFSFDTPDNFFRRQHNGMTQEDYKEFMDALFGDHRDIEKAYQILKERTWEHLGKI